MLPRNKRAAFSLIELSIVILVIGILIAGVVQGSKLFSKSRIQIAQNLTKSSPVNGIKDLATWYETSMSASFNESDAIDGNPVYIWHDINPQRVFRNDANNVSSVVYPNSCTNCPTYVENGINGLPVVYLNYNNSARLLLTDSSVLYDTDITIFVVGLKGNLNPSGYNVFIGSQQSGPYFFLGFQSSLTRFVTASGNGDTYVGAPLAKSPLFMTAQLSQTTGKKTWMFGSSTASCTNTTDTTLLTAATYGQIYLGQTIAGAQSDINIAELIIFQRALSTEERVSVEKYLSQKYGVKIRQMSAVSC